MKTELRGALMGGYNRKDVEQFLETEAREKEAKIQELQEKCDILQTENQALQSDKEKLEENLAEYNQRKEALAKVELDAQVRAEKRLEKAEKEAKAQIDLAKEQAEELVETAQKQADTTLAETKLELEREYESQEKRCQDLRTELEKAVAEAKIIQGEIGYLMEKFLENGTKIRETLDRMERFSESVERAEDADDVVAMEPVAVETVEKSASVAEMFQKIMEDEKLAKV